MSATDLAQRKNKTGPFSPTYRLEIAGSRFRGQLYDASASYAADGTSEMSISADGDLSDYVGAKVRLEVGYGEHLWEYFTGYLEDPEDDYWGEPSNAVAYGPFKELAEASIGEDVTYQGYTLGGAIADLHRRAGRAVVGTKYEIRGNPTFLLEGEQAGLTLSTKFADGINTFLEAAGWVGVDRPGFQRVYRPRPRPRPSSKAVASYSEAHYLPGAFKAIPAKPYGSVRAYALDEDGRLKWPVVKVGVDSLSPYKASELKIYWFEDFLLSEEDALLECGELAALLSDGVYTWTLSDISANPDLHLYDIIRVSTTESRDMGGRHKERYAVTYACAIDTDVSVNVSREGHPMNLSGTTAIKLSERRLKRPFYVGRGTSPVVRV